VTRGNRDADAGVARKAITVTVERRSQRLINLFDKRADVVVEGNAVLDDGEFIAAKAGDEVVRPNRLAQPLRDAFQELVPDQMAQ
jgi:hypothetical protein